MNPAFPDAENRSRDVHEAARSANLSVHVLSASTDRALDSAFESVSRQRIRALIVAADPFFDTRRDKLVALAARSRVPTMYHFREFAEAGGLMSYGIDFSDVYRQVGVYVGRVLKGTKPSELPVLRPTKFELVINVKTAKALGLTIPPSLVLRADQAIE